jgi:L-seryl-tRNA(Ser) seleniumtransferase/D-glucosaminate-6-phosphate ammonia-lyase
MGLRRVVNASGRVTVLGVSTISDRVAAAAVRGGQSYVVIEDLMTRAGELISRHTGAEASCPTSCASAAIALTVAALVTKGRYTDMMRLPDSAGLANEIVLQKGHSVNYGAPIPTMIRLGGGVPVEVGQANEVYPEDIEGGITPRTVALLYVKSHHCVQKGMVGIETMRDIAHAHGLPLMMDCAAEEDFRKYIALGADVVCYSGAKALEATTSGFVTGRADIVANVQKQYQGIGRAMKVGKEQIAGLVEGLDQYDEKDPAKAATRNNDLACREGSGRGGARHMALPREG